VMSLQPPIGDPIMIRGPSAWALRALGGGGDAHPDNSNSMDGQRHGRTRT
jgi:hypothetical protein